MTDRVNDWPIKWPTDWMTDRMNDRPIKWPTDWIIDRLNDRPTEWPTKWMTDRLNDRPNEWPTDWMTDQMNDRPTEWPTERMTNRLNDRPTEWLTEWMIDGPTDKVKNLNGWKLFVFNVLMYTQLESFNHGLFLFKLLFLFLAVFSANKGKFTYARLEWKISMARAYQSSNPNLVFVPLCSF